MSDLSYNELMQNYVDAPYDVLLDVAMNSLTKVMPFFDRIDDNGNGANIVFPFICVTIAADGNFSELEYIFLKDVTGQNTSYSEFKDIIQNYYTTSWVNSIDNLIDSCPDDIRYALLVFCLAFAAVDHHITSEENAYFRKLLD